MKKQIKRRKKNKRKLTLKYLKSILKYNRKTGIFRWRERLRVDGQKHPCSNKIAGTLMNQGYIHIGINGKLYLAHRLAWFYVYEYFPEYQIDHKDQVKHHNWILNLREVTQSCNMQNCKISKNNTSGITGVRWGEGNQRWKVSISKGDKNIYLGYYRNKLNAAKARLKAEQKYFNCTVESSAEKFIKNYRPIKRRQ